MTYDECYARFLEAVKQAGGQRGFATIHKITPAYVNDLVHRRRDLSDRVLGLLGIIRIVQTTYQEAADETAE